MIARVLALIAAVLAGCAATPPGGAPVSESEPAANADDASPVFPDFAPILPARTDQAGVGVTPAVESTARDTTAVKELLRPPAEGGPLPEIAPLALKDMPLFERRLAEVAKELKARYGARAPGDLDDLARMQLIASMREGMLLLLLTKKIDGEPCRVVLETLKKFPVQTIEVAGLQFVLYQYLSDDRKRDDALEYLIREHEARESFRLEDLQFCKEVPAGRDKYVAVERTEFKRGERLRIYCGFRGAKAAKLPGGGNGQHLQAFLSVLDGAEKRLQVVEFLDTASGVKELKGGEAAGSPSYIYGTYDLPSTVPPGEYRLELSVRDLAASSARESKAAAKFTVKD